VRAIYRDYWELTVRHKLAQIYDEARYDVRGLLRLHKIVKHLGLGEKEIIKVLELAKYDELQNLQWKVEYLRNDISLVKCGVYPRIRTRYSSDIRTHTCRANHAPKITCLSNKIECVPPGEPEGVLPSASDSQISDMFDKCLCTGTRTVLRQRYHKRYHNSSNSRSLLPSP
jgi:hypothetical protein